MKRLLVDIPLKNESNPVWVKQSVSRDGHTRVHTQGCTMVMAPGGLDSRLSRGLPVKLHKKQGVVFTVRSRAYRCGLKAPSSLLES